MIRRILEEESIISHYRTALQFDGTPRNTLVESVAEGNSYDQMIWII